MTDDTKKENVLDLSNLTLEEQEVLWQGWVKNEVNAVLDIFLPVSKAGDVNVSYNAVVIEETEAGKVFSDCLKDAVMVSLVFKFKEPINISEPRIKDEKSSEESK
jgi:hypothetical protein